RVDAPVDQGFDEHVAGGRFGHSSLLVDLRESRPRKKSPAALLTGRAAPQFRFGRMTVTATSRTGRVREWNFLIRRTISPAAGESSGDLHAQRTAQRRWRPAHLRGRDADRR